MLKKPNLQDKKIAACLLENYGLLASQVTSLPLGADQNTAVYRVGAGNETPCFLKLRSGDSDETSVALTKFLGDQGIRQIIAPLPTKTGQLQATLAASEATFLAPFKVTLYPFIAGHNGYETRLTDDHWREFGAALKRIHQVDLPPALLERIGRETFSPRWRESVRVFLERAEYHVFADPLAGKLAAFLLANHDEILYLVERAQQLAQSFQARLAKAHLAKARASEFVLCHADVHAGNILIGAAGAFYIVDWDEAILAPKERDLMFIGGSLLGGWRSPQEEETLFYEAYGQTMIDPIGLAYYRYERIIQDIAVICEQIFSAAGSVEDRQQFFGYLKSNFLPINTIEQAYRADKAGGRLSAFSRQQPADLTTGH